jgi:hypothetical protein
MCLGLLSLLWLGVFVFEGDGPEHGPGDVHNFTAAQRLFRSEVLCLSCFPLTHAPVPHFSTGTSTIKVGSMSPTTHPKHHHAAPVDKAAESHHHHHGTSALFACLLACLLAQRPLFLPSTAHRHARVAL